MSREPVYLSREGREKLEKELKNLKTVERPRIVAEISRAMQMGDLSENAEYHAAKEEQQHLERRIGELEDKLSRVRSVDIDKIPTDKAYLFAKVLVKDLDRGEQIEYKIMPPEEADIDNDEISIKSPIGAGLLGKSVGEKVKIQIPIGTLHYEILKISRD
ncbi:MAG TPA: transcription elongation factor GreA [candidate division Zixibacteria bacterium]|nr:transcription elongation factor GreA [candidate division Zixibacteria bacterium]